MRHILTLCCLVVGTLAFSAVQRAGGIAQYAVSEYIRKNAKVEADSKKHTPNQEALSDFAKKHGKKGVSNIDADTLLDWAKEYDFPHRDDRGKPHWDAKDGMDHIHLGPKHIPVIN